MSPEMQTTSTNPKWMFWTGWVLSALPSALLIWSASAKLMESQQVIDGLKQHGWPTNVAFPLGVVELVSTLLYLIPQTAVLGAILLTGYMGGAISHHVRISDPFFIQVAIGVVIWLGVCFRDPRLWKLIPIRR